MIFHYIWEFTSGFFKAVYMLQVHLRYDLIIYLNWICKAVYKQLLFIVT